MFTKVNKRGWKTDRMLALKLVMPRAVDAIAYENWGEHEFDYAVCDFFGLDHSKENFSSLRRIAAKMCSKDFPLKIQWSAMAQEIRAIERP